MRVYKGRVARRAGLVITTALAAAAIQHTTWDKPTMLVATVLCMVVGALTAAVASDYSGE